MFFFAGAFLLHKMSLAMDLDFFILFSSVTSVLGNSGQATYSASNAFLDGLAQYRRLVLGLPALSINWGPIGGTGILERFPNLSKLMISAGYRLISAKQGTFVL